MAHIRNYGNYKLLVLYRRVKILNINNPTINAGINDNVTKYVRAAALIVQSSFKKSVMANVMTLYVFTKNFCMGLKVF